MTIADCCEGIRVTVGGRTGLIWSVYRGSVDVWFPAGLERNLNPLDMRPATKQEIGAYQAEIERLSDQEAKRKAAETQRWRDRLASMDWSRLSDAKIREIGFHVNLDTP